MITLRELLSDKRYREYFLKIPVLPELPRTGPPWRLYVQRESGGPWARREYDSYRDAFRHLKRIGFSDCHDACIQSKGTAFNPPHRVVKVTRGGIPLLHKDGSPITKVVWWKPSIPGDEAPHRWCPYCRRPTIFAWFTKHHAFRGGAVFNPSLLRCTICGASENLVNER